MTTAEIHFTGDTPRVFVNGHRLRLVFALAAVLVPIGVAWDYRASQRRGLRS